MAAETSDRESAVLCSVDLPDGSESGGWLYGDGDRRVLRLFGEHDVQAGDELELPGERYLTVVDARHRALEDWVVTDLTVEGPNFRQLEGHALGDGWPQRYWRDLAERCYRDGFARPVVRFLELLGELRTFDQIRLARGEMRSLSAEHLAAAAGQVAGALMNLRHNDAPEDLVDAVAALYGMLLDEVDTRCERREYLQPPNPAAHVRIGRHPPDVLAEIRDWRDVVAGEPAGP